MKRDLVHPRKARSGDHVAIVSPSFAAAGAYPAIHEQAMRRLTEVTGLVPVVYPTTRQVDARAADINSGAVRAIGSRRGAFADSSELQAAPGGARLHGSTTEAAVGG